MPTEREYWGQSSPAMIQAFLQSRGAPLTGENASRAMVAAAQGNAPDLARTQSTDPGVGQGGNVAGRVEQAPVRRLPIPPTPPASGGQEYNQPAAPTTTSAAPDTGPNVNLGNLGAAILGGGAGGMGYWAQRGRTGMPTPGGGPTVNVGNMTTPGGIASANNTIDYTQLPPGQPVQTGDRFGINTRTPTNSPEGIQDPLTAALARAVQPPAVMPYNPPGPSTPIGPTSPTGNPTPTITPQEAGGRIIPTPPGLFPNRPSVNVRPTDIPTIRVRPPRMPFRVPG